MREIAQSLLRDCDSRPESPECGIAHRLNGETHWFEGNFLEARADLGQALTIFDPERDCELAFRFGQDIIVTATASHLSGSRSITVCGREASFAPEHASSPGRSWSVV